MRTHRLARIAATTAAGLLVVVGSTLTLSVDVLAAGAGGAAKGAAASGASPAAAPQADIALGRQLFNGGAQPACAVCHTLKDAGAEGAVGPVLDELKPDADRVATALRNGVGAMPSFKGSLTEAQIQALAVYVSTVSGH